MHPQSILPPLKYLIIPFAVIALIFIAKLVISGWGGPKFKLKTP